MPADAILTFPDYVIGNEGDPGVELVMPEYSRHYAGYLDYWYNQRRGEPLPAIDIDAIGEAVLEVNHGRWVWQCPGCYNGELVQDEQVVICFNCAVGGWKAPIWPENRAEIEAELLQQPGYRLLAPVRNWKPGWSMDYLRERTAKAHLLLSQGASLVRALSIGTTRIWEDAEVLTAANMNLYVSGIMDDLAGRNGEQELEDSLRVLNGDDGDRFLGVPGGTTNQRPSSPRAGTFRFNSTNGAIDLYNGTTWVQVLDTSAMTYRNLSAQGLVGSGASQIAQGNHGH